MKYFNILFLFVFSQTVEAAYTESLPKGVRSFVYRYVQGDLKDQFDESGNVKPYELHERLGADVLRVFSPSVKGALEELAEIDPRIVDEIDVGQVDAHASFNLKGHGMALAWGITDELTVAGILPVIQASVHLDSKVTQTGSMDKVIRRLQTIARKEGPLQENAEAWIQIFDQVPKISGEHLQGVLVEDFGYQPVGDWSSTGVGDLELFGQYRYLETPHYKQAAKLGFTFPTGRVDNPDNLVDIGFGNGAVSTNLESLHDFDVLGDGQMIASFQADYKFQWPTTRTFRLYTDPHLPLTPDKESLRFKPGNKLGIQIGAEYLFFKLIGLATSYRVETKLRDSMSGKKSDYDYSILTEETNEVKRTWQTTLKFMTTHLYVAKKFPIPFKVGLTYSRSMGGVNVERLNQGYMDLQFFF